VDHQDVEGIAILRLGRRDESPVVRIGEAGHQGLGKREHAQLRIEVQFAGAPTRRFDNGVYAAQVGIFSRFVISVAFRRTDRIGQPRSPARSEMIEAIADRLRTRFDLKG
jgi:hypothetical protein